MPDRRPVHRRGVARRRAAITLPGLVLAALACSGAEQRRVDAARVTDTTGVASAPPVMPTVRVENGVTIFEHDLEAFDRAPRLRIDETPIASLGGADDAYDLTWVNNVVLLSDGRFATLSQVDNRLLIFHADGRGQRAIGRTGEAPGEFMAPQDMIPLTGDTLFIVDGANRRLNWVHPDEGVVVSRPYAATGDLRHASPAGVLRDDRVVIHLFGMVQEGLRDSLAQPPAPVGVLNPHDGSVREIASIPDMETVVIETRYRGRLSTQPSPAYFGLRGHIAVVDTLIATASSPRYEIDLRNDDGAVVAQIRVPRARRAVTQRMRDGLVARQLEMLGAGGEGDAVDAAEIRRIARETPSRDSLPPFSHWSATHGGLLWVVDPIAPGDSTWSATAFRADGAIVGRLEGDGKRLPIVFGDDRVVLYVTDENDVVTLRVHRLAP